MKTNRFIKFGLVGLISCLSVIVQAQPTWSFNSPDYLYSMTITGKIQFEGAASKDVKDMVGAFINGQCRGIANVKYIQSVDDYYVFLMVYSNSTTDNVTFRLFDSSANLEISAKETATFSVNGNLGSSLNPFIFNAENVNVAPTGISLSLVSTPALAVGNTVIASLSASDSNADDSHTFSLQSGNGVNDKDNWRFFIEGDKLKSRGDVYFHKGDTYNVLITALDKAGATVSIPLTVTPRADAVFSSECKLLSFSINEQIGETVYSGNDVYVKQNWNGDLQSVAVSFSISAQARAYINNVEKASGTLTDMRNPVSLVVEAPDKSTTTYTLHVITTNDIPTNIQLSNSKVDENAEAALVGTLTTVTENSKETHVYTLLEEPGTDYSLFKINGSELRTSKVLDYETKSTYLVKIRADDQHGGTVDKQFTVTLTNKNDTPTDILLSQQTFNSDAAANTVVGDLTAKDQDAGDSHVFTLVNGNGTNDNGNNLVKITGNKLVLANPIKDVSKLSWNVLIRATDKLNASYEKSLAINVKVANNLPVFDSKPVSYTMQNDVFVYIVEASDKDGDTITISFDNLPKWINYYPDLNLLTGSPGNNEVGTYNFTIKASDKKSSVSQKVTLMVLDVNDPPVINNFISDQDFVTGRDNQFSIPGDSFKDPDSGDKLTYSVSMNNNTAFPSWLTFDPATRTLKGNPPKEASGIYQLKLTVSDQKLMKEFMIFNLNVALPLANTQMSNTGKFSVYPNPVADYININFPESLNTTNLKLQITDMKGRILKNVEKLEESSKSFFVGDLPAGLYFVMLQIDKSVFTEKIVKK